MRGLILFVTSRCNGRCIMCFNESINTGSRGLSLEEYYKIADNVKVLDDLMISGGEPTLREDLPDICRIFHEKTGVRKIRLPVNGLDTARTVKVVEAILKSCPDCELFINLPLDGTEKTHDLQRGVPGAFDAVNRTYQALSKIRSIHPNLRVGFVTTITTLNFNELQDVIDHVKRMNPRPSHHTLMVCRAQTKKVGSELLVTAEECGKVLDASLKSSGGRVQNLLMRPLFHVLQKCLNHVYFMAYSGVKIIECTAAEDMRVVDADGGVRVCEMTEVIGNVRDFNYDVWSVSVPAGLRAQIKECSCTHPCFVIPSMKHPKNTLKAMSSMLKNMRGT